MEPPEARVTSRRLFFALWPQPDCAGALEQKAVLARQQCGGRLMDRDTLHLTLAFLGQVEEQRIPEICALASTVKLAGFTLILDQLGYWHHNRILWAGSTSPPSGLFSLANHLQGALRSADFMLDDRPFQAHVTLLRNARCGVDALGPWAICWPVKDFALVESLPSAQGADYRVLKRWPLV